MQNLSATFVSGLACLGGVACLTRVVLAVRSPIVLFCTINPFQRLLLAVGCLCACSTFLFLPAGSFPAWLPGDTPMLYWFASFSLACAALALLPGPRGSAARQLAVPLILGVGYGLCVWYACRHGLPGNLWQMERFVAVPLLSHAGGLAGVGVLCLAGAATLSCSAALTAQSAAPFLATSLQLAAAQYIVCLVAPLLPSRLLPMPPLAGLLADFFACWISTGLMLPLFHAARRHVPGWLPWLLTACGLFGLLAF